MQKFLCQSLLFFMLIAPTAEAKRSLSSTETAFDNDAVVSVEPIDVTLPESITIKRSDLEELKNNVENFDTNKAAQEVLGGKIVSKADGSTITLECVEKNSEGECTKAQYMHSQGVASQPLSVTINMTALMDFMNKLKDGIKKEVNSKLQSMDSDFTVMPVTKYIFDKGNGIWATTSFLGLFLLGAGLPSLLMTLGVIATVASPVGTLLVVSGIFTAILWPIVADLVILPFRATARGIKALKLNIQNRKVKKRAKRIQKALDITLRDGNRSIELRGSDFEYLLKILGT